MIKTAIIYAEYYEYFADLEDEQVGILFKSIFGVMNGEPIQQMDEDTKEVFEIIMTSIISNHKKYQRRIKEGQKNE